MNGTTNLCEQLSILKQLRKNSWSHGIRLAIRTMSAIEKIKRVLNGMNSIDSETLNPIRSSSFQYSRQLL